MDCMAESVEDGPETLRALLMRYIDEDDADVMDDIAERIRVLAYSDPSVALYLSMMLENGVVFPCDPDLAGLYRRIS